MREFLRNCGLNPEEINMVEVFILLHGYNTLEELLAKTNEELKQLHAQWDEDIARCLEIVRAHQN